MFGVPEGRGGSRVEVPIFKKSGHSRVDVELLFLYSKVSIDVNCNLYSRRKFDLLTNVLMVIATCSIK